MSKHKFSYDWTLKDAVFTKDKGKVFSCFACGGGSTMGYKLAGFDVIGMNEIDPRMAACYIENHKPKHAYIEDIRTLVNREDLPEEMYNLDILDGSPPCSSFSISGNREKDWGKEKMFKEGQAKQVLDTLFFDFIDLGEKLQPKIIVAENVKGMLIGKAKSYVKKILQSFDEAGYVVKYYLLNAKDMGVPQKRERVFFIAIRKDLAAKMPLNPFSLCDEFPFIDMQFNEPEIFFREFFEPGNTERMLTEHMKNVWNNRINGDTSFEPINERVLNRKHLHFNYMFIYPDRVPYTVTGSDACVLFEEPRYKSKLENIKTGSFPTDYNFLDRKEFYLIGMSVPPVMVAQIADRIHKHLLSKIK